MDRSRPAARRVLLAASLLTVVAASAGCYQMLLTPIIMFRGYDVPADYDGLRGKQVAVVCRPPATLEYSLGGVDREVAKRVAALLSAGDKKITVIDPRKVEDYVDEQDLGDLKQLAEYTKADTIVYIDLEGFSLQKDQTLYQGRATAIVTVYDMADGGKEVWQKSLTEQFPENAAVPALEKPLGQFRRQFVGILAERISRHFYKHDPYVSFADDSLAYK